MVLLNSIELTPNKMKYLYKIKPVVAATILLTAGTLLSPTRAKAACPPTWVEVGDAPSTVPGQLTDCVIPSDNIGANITGTLSDEDLTDIFQVTLSQPSIAQGFTFGSSSLLKRPNASIIFTAYDFNQVIVGAPIVLNSPFPESNSAFAELFLNPGTYYLKVHGEKFNKKDHISYQFQASFVPPTESDVPGPLCIFGVGAAFAYSRKLRNRIALQK